MLHSLSCAVQRSDICTLHLLEQSLVCRRALTSLQCSQAARLVLLLESAERTYKLELPPGGQPDSVRPLLHHLQCVALVLKSA